MNCTHAANYFPYENDMTLVATYENDYVGEYCACEVYEHRIKNGDDREIVLVYARRMPEYNGEEFKNYHKGAISRYESWNTRFKEIPLFWEDAALKVLLPKGEGFDAEDFFAEYRCEATHLPTSKKVPAYEFVPMWEYDEEE